MKRSLSLASLSLAALVTLSACGPSSGGDKEGSAGTGGSSAQAGHNDADVMFAQQMIPHHEQAVEMSELMLAKDGISPEVTDLATRIKEAQGPEIRTMTGWLDAWGEPVEADGGMEGHDMGSDMGSDTGSDTGGSASDGMLSEDELSELDAADGSDASRLFLESMTAHHEGAVGMAQDEIDDGQHPEAIALAERVVETQTAEITEMDELLAGP
ncbi:DUF305 domain-containing protein [Arthrobacter sp. Soc17.1.1.1]|uniref:DUF305 domain-containing protein n=1 Tax=Arthrobacter sp. Soc17.1.1.1 TaxID=3121277 RepID=UPI002FE44475